MYRCMLVPLDGTAFGEHALPYAVSIARRTGAKLHLTHVHLPPIIPSGAETAALPPAWSEATLDEKKLYLDSLAERLASIHPVGVETRIIEGGVATALEHEAMSCAVGLIVMSTHAHVGLSRLWHHGVADQLARDLSLPMLLVRPGEDEPAADLREEPRLEHILVPLDGSLEAEMVLEHAIRLGRTFGARYTLLRVMQPETVIGYPLLGQDTQLSRYEHQREQTVARQHLNAVAERMRSTGLDVTTDVIAAADAAEAVIERVRSSAGSPQDRIDLIAIEARQRGPVTRLLIRGTADTLLKGSPVPVLLFQPAVAVAASAPMEPGLAGGG